ncbi:MAG TPA: choice-of-anchor Q domain-containing protein [Rhodanobacteraceae bacterium]|nr:choice-of-anchor Q domain-containing protein [Rhodanobacteraceae bacterium]
MRFSITHCGLAAALACACLPATAAILTVTDLGDAGTGVCTSTCTLRDAIASAAPGDSIDFAATLTYPATITLGGQRLLIYKDVTVLGPGAERLTIDANQQSRIFELTNNATATLSGLRLIHGQITGRNGTATDPDGGDAYGGAIRVGAGASLQLVRCVLSHNAATGGFGFSSFSDTAGRGGTAYGGAIASAGTVSLLGTTLDDNKALGGQGGSLSVGENSAGAGGMSMGGAIHSTGAFDIVNTQLLRNHAIGGAGGVGFAGTGGSGGDGGDGGSGGGKSGGAGGSASGGAIHADAFVALAFVSGAENDAVAGVGGNGDPVGAPGSALGADLASTSTTVARNSVFVSLSAVANCDVTNVSTQDHNIARDGSCAGFTTVADPKLAILDSATSPVAMPLWGSALIDAAGSCMDAFGATITQDARGQARPLDANADGVAACDIGAVESDALFANGYD